MEWTDVVERIRNGENETTELKRWEAFPSRVAETVCALANSAGGLIVLGIADDGTVVGVPGDPDDVQERLTSFLQSGLSTPIRGRTGRHRDESGWVHWVEVLRYRGPDPLRCRGRVLVRRGRASVVPSPSELQDLFNTFGFVLTEEQLVPHTTPADIETRSFREFLSRQGLDLEADPQVGLREDLLNRGVIAEDDGEDHATLYGLLCFGRDPQDFPPTSNAWIECIAYAGRDRATDVILEGKARGRLDEQVERALGWVQALGTRETYGDIERTDRPIVPVRALREALVNAVAHRDYAILGSKTLFEVFQDRVVVTSPGDLPNNMTAAAALSGGHPRSRNELVANFLLVRGFMERRGRGLPIIRREMREFNGSEPVLVSDRDDRFVRLTLRRDGHATG